MLRSASTLPSSGKKDISDTLQEMVKEIMVTKNLLLTLDAKDDGIGILHVGPAYAENGLLGV